MTSLFSKKKTGKLGCETPYSLNLFVDDGYGNRVLKTMPEVYEIEDFYSKIFSRQSYRRFGKKLEAFRRAWFCRRQLLKCGFTNPKVLEFGCGNGQFLAAFRSIDANVTLSGVEFLNPDLLEIASKNQICCFSSLDELDAQDGAFDLIALWHVVEHMVDPWNLLDRLSHLLKKNGILVFSTPNMFCQGVQSFPSDWPWNQPPPIHLWHFDPISLRKRLESQFPNYGLNVFTRESRDANFLFDAFIYPLVFKRLFNGIGKNLRFQALTRLMIACINEAFVNPVLKKRKSGGSEIIAVLEKN